MNVSHDFASVMVHLDAGSRSLYRLELGAGLALQLDVPLTCLYSTFQPDPAWLRRTDDGDRYLGEIEQWHQRTREQMRRQWAALMPELPRGTRWLASEADPLDFCVRTSRQAGLLLLGLRDDVDEHAFVAPGFVETMVMASGRPVLLIPPQGRCSLHAPHAVIAWDGSREASRALHDAMPLLAGGSATIFHGAKPGDATRGGGGLHHAIAVLAEHGVYRDVRVETVRSDSDVTRRLLEAVADTGASLLVMGAYGHGTVRQFVLGGVTRMVLARAVVPVLMSH